MYVISFDKTVVRVALDGENLSLYNALYVVEAGVVLEVRELDLHYAVCISMQSIHALRVNMKVVFKSRYVEFKFYDKYIGRVLDPSMNILSEHKDEVVIGPDDSFINVSLDSERADIADVDCHLKAMLTGIKVIDFFAPYVIGGKIGIVGGAGVGKTTLMLEIINNLLSSNYFVVFVGVGERIREGHAFYKDVIDAGLIDVNDCNRSNMSFIFGNMDQSPNVRYASAQVGAALAEAIRDTRNTNVLLLIDNVFRFLQAGNEISASLKQVPGLMGYQPDLISTMSMLQERINSTHKGSITSVQAIYVPADDFTDPAVLSCMNHVDTVIYLDRNLSAKGIYPSIDPVRSYSKIISKGTIGKHHYEVHRRVIGILQRYSELENIVKIMGIDNLSKQDQLIVHRAKLIYAYITQPFKVSCQFTGIAGEHVDLDVVISEMEEIVEGVYDNVDNSNILYKGSIAQFKSY